jgi:Putative transposase
MRCGAQCLDDFYSEVRGRVLKGGYIAMIHTHGRNGQYHPHVHVTATSGGYDAQAESWEHLTFLPYDLVASQVAMASNEDIASDPGDGHHQREEMSLLLRSR